MIDPQNKAELSIESNSIDSNSIEQVDTELLVKGKKKGKSTELTSVNISAVAEYTNEGGDSNHGNKEEIQVPIPTQDNERKENFNDTPNVTAKGWNEELHRNMIFFGEFKRTTIQMTFILALIILAIEWQPLQQLFEKSWFFLVIALVVLTTYCVLLVVVIKLRQTSRFRIILGRIYFLLCTIGLNFAIVGYSKFTTLSSYWVVLAAGTFTSNCLFITVLTYFQQTCYRDWAAYIFATFLPLLFLFLSQFCYYMWFVNTSYEDFMINVWLGIGVAIIWTFGKIARTQHGAKGKNGILYMVNGDIRLVDLKTGVEPQAKSIPVNV